MHYNEPILREKLKTLNESGRLLNREETFTARIYVGFLDTEKELTYSPASVSRICQDYVEEEGLCVNIQETSYHYGSEGEGGSEPGAVVELIHYPRFPLRQPQETVTVRALDLAEKLMAELHQKRVSVVTSDDTYTLQNPGHSEI